MSFFMSCAQVVAGLLFRICFGLGRLNGVDGQMEGRADGVDGWGGRAGGAGERVGRQ